MEDDKKKKKKNNKKKNKQHPAKPNETSSLDDAGASTPDQHQLYVPPVGLDDSRQVSNKDAARQLKNGREEEQQQHQQENLAKAKELHWLDKEAVIEEKIKYLLKEKDEMLQKEAAQEDIIRLLNHDKNESILQQTHLKEKIVHLEKEKNDLCHKEGSLEQRIEQLQMENHAHLQKEADLDMKIVQLEGEKDSWLQKEAALEEKIHHLVDDAAVLNLKGVSLEEKVKQMECEKDSWILREKHSAKESITIQNSENIELRAQVIKLEQSSKSLIEEKQQLEEKLSSLELQINDLQRTVRFPNLSEVNKETSDDGEATHQLEVAHALVEKLTKENSELVEKINELYAELDQRGKRQEDSFSIPALGLPLTLQSVDSASLPHQNTAAVDTILEVSKAILTSSSSISLEDVMIEDRRNNEQHLNGKGAFEPANTSEIIEVDDEIVQIPLHENEVTGTTHLKKAENDDLKSDIPLTDAPLIGAPFRFISFVAKYVSGADLVK